VGFLPHLHMRKLKHISPSFEEGFDVGSPNQGYNNFHLSPQAASNPWSEVQATRYVEPRYMGGHVDGHGLTAEDYYSDSLLAMPPSAPRNFNLFVTQPHTRLRPFAQKDAAWKAPRLVRSAEPASPHEAHAHVSDSSQGFAAAFPPHGLFRPQAPAVTSPRTPASSTAAQRRRWDSAAAAYAAAAGDLVFANGGGGDGGSAAGGFRGGPRALASRSSSALNPASTFRRVGEHSHPQMLPPQASVSFRRRT
jgi:hypothetical protein